jgi:hypothetical protein
MIDDKFVSFYKEDDGMYCRDSSGNHYLLACWEEDDKVWFANRHPIKQVPVPEETVGEPITREEVIKILSCDNVDWDDTEPKEFVLKEFEVAPSGGPPFDEECLQICKTLCSLHGIRTIESCSGHGESRFFVSFTAENVEDLRPIVEAVDEDDDWILRVGGQSMIYFFLQGPIGQPQKADKLAETIIHICRYMS